MTTIWQSLSVWFVILVVASPLVVALYYLCKAGSELCQICEKIIKETY